MITPDMHLALQLLLLHIWSILSYIVITIFFKTLICSNIIIKTGTVLNKTAAEF